MEENKDGKWFRKNWVEKNDNDEPICLHKKQPFPPKKKNISIFL